MESTNGAVVTNHAWAKGAQHLSELCCWEQSLTVDTWYKRFVMSGHDCQQLPGRARAAR